MPRKNYFSYEIIVGLENFDKWAWKLIISSKFRNNFWKLKFFSTREAVNTKYEGKAVPMQTRNAIVNIWNEGHAYM